MFGIRQRFHAVIVLTLLSISSAQQQAPAKSEKPSPGASPSDEFSQRSFEALLRERDSLTAEVDGLAIDINWVNDAIAKREEMKRQKAFHKATDEIEKAVNL